MAAARCGTIPSVQPTAATTLARLPWASPAAIVYNTPVPGVATMINDVSRNAVLMPTAPKMSRRVRRYESTRRLQPARGGVAVVEAAVVTPLLAGPVSNGFGRILTADGEADIYGLADND